MTELFSEGTVDLEKSLIGAVIVRPELLVELPWLETGHFAHLPCRTAWEAIRNLEAKSRPIDTITIEAELERDGRLESIGGIAELGLWVAGFASAQNAHEYAREIREHALHRRVLLAMSDMVTRGRARKAYGTDLLGEMLGSLTALDVEDVKDESKAIGELTHEHVKYLEQQAARRAAGAVDLTGVPTGVDGLDAEIGGWQFGIVAVLCARPAMGKSSVGLATADVATSRGIGTHVFSMEDPRKMYMNRVLSRLSGVPISRLATADLQRGDMQPFIEARHMLTAKNRPWLVDDRSGLTAEEIIRSVRRHRKANGTKLVIIDYIQLVKRGRASLAKSRHEVITEIIHELADAAKNDGMAYLVMSQLNRSLESRDDKRPQESDLRESGTLEERAKTIVALYRGAKYGPGPVDGIDMDEDGKLMSAQRLQSTIQLLVLKNSQGQAPVRVLANWHGPTTKVW